MRERAISIFFSAQPQPDHDTQIHQKKSSGVFHRLALFFAAAMLAL
jgi:hypothetical protein